MKRIVMTLRRHGRLISLLMAFGALGLGLMAVLMGQVLSLSACHLCIFQRVIHFAIGLVLLLAFWSWRLKILALISLASAAGLSIWGMVASGQQSWMQWFPESGFSCVISDPGLTEQLINALGELYPLFFMASGSCASKDLVIFGLSLANWSFMAFMAFLAGCVALIFSRIANTIHERING